MEFSSSTDKTKVEESPSVIENDSSNCALLQTGKYKNNDIEKTQWTVCQNINTCLLFLFGIVSIALGIIICIYPLFTVFLTERLKMTPGLPPFEWWLNPEPDVFCRAYIFAVTNPNEFLNGTDKKMKLEEIGPIVYKERLVHSNVVFNENSTLSYTIKRYVEFVPELNEPGILNKTVIVPNIVLLGMASVLADYMFTFKVGFNMLSRNDPLFMNTTIYNYLWNLTTPALVTVDKYLSFMVPQDNGGTMHTVYKDFSDQVNVRIGPKYGFDDFFMINTWNYRPIVPGFLPEKGDCFASIVNSTEGALYSNFLTKDSVISYWRKTVCRPVSLYFEKEVQKGSILGYKYIAQTSLYDRMDNLTADCYKGLGSTTLPDGLSDVSKCYSDLPVAVSSPHFYGRNGYWDEQLEGFTPSKEKHGSFAIIEPITGVPMEQIARSQSNMIMPKLRGFNSNMTRFSEMVVPILWLEYHQEKLTPSIDALLIFTSNFLPTLQYLLPVILLATGFLYIYFGVKRLSFQCEVPDIKKQKETIYSFNKAKK